MGRFVHALWVGGLLFLVTGCIVPEPKPAQLGAARRYGTPEETFESLRTAFQAEVLEWEYECFSIEFTHANGFSSLTYRAFRPELLARVPRLRWGLSRAVVEEITYPAEGRALLRARVPVPFLDDPVIELGMVREEYLQLYVGDVVVADVLEDLRKHLQIDPKRLGTHGNGTIWINLDLNDESFDLDTGDPLTVAGLLEGFTRIEGGREWKVDQFGLAPEED